MHNKSKNDIVKVQGFEGTWQIFLEVKQDEQVRYVAENLASEQMMILSSRDGIYHRSAGPASWEETKAAATGIIFNRGSAVDALKITAGAYLVFTSRVDEFKNQPNPKKRK